MRRRLLRPLWAALVALLLIPVAVRAAALPDPAAARAYLVTVQPAPELQAFLDRTLAALAAADPALRRSTVRVALLDLPKDGPPRLAHSGGDQPIYPASVVKFVYLMAAYAWQEEGRLTIDPAFDAELSAMIRESSNQATQKVFARLTKTTPGPELAGDEYRTYRDRRQSVKRWLATFGIDDLHCVNPTYDGTGDLVGRDQQFVRDRTVAGGLPSADGSYANRQAMTAIGTAKLLALLATDRALTPEDSATVRRRMKRDPKEQPHLAHRIAGGAARIPGLEVYAKSGTWGPDYADAGIVRRVSDGKQFVVVVFTEGTPPYRGEFIAQLTYRAALHILGDESLHADMPRNWPMAPTELDYRLAYEDFTIDEVKSAGGGVTGAQRLTVRFDDGQKVKIKWKPFPAGTLDGWDNSPRKEIATYRVQRWLFDEEDYVVPTTIPICIPLDRYAPIDPKAHATIAGSSCVLGVVAIWMDDVTKPDDLFDKERFAKDAEFARHLADCNLLTYLTDHRDGRDGNFLVSTDPKDPRVFAVDNGIAFEGFPWNFFVRNWNVIRVPWLRREPIERLRAVSPDDVRAGLASLVDLVMDDGGMFRVQQPTAPIDAKKGVRKVPGRVQLGLTTKEIENVQERITDLLARVDRGDVRVQ